jgi:hypothetical protein
VWKSKLWKRVLYDDWNYSKDEDQGEVLISNGVHQEGSRGVGSGLLLEGGEVARPNEARAVSTSSHLVSTEW